MTAKIIFAGILAVLCAGCAGALLAQDGPPVFEGELIVKFKAGEDIDVRISEALGSADADARHPEIGSYVDQLAKKLGVPLVTVRITSGRELLVAVPRQAYLESLAARIRSAPEVRTVEIGYDAAALWHSDRLVVEFHEGANSLRRLVESDEAECGEVARSIVATLLEQPASSFEGRRLDDNRLEIGVDVRKVALDLSARLNERADVDYAQPNFAVRVYDDSRC